MHRSLKNLELVASKVASDIAAGSLKVHREKPFSAKVMEVALKSNFIKDQIFNKAKSQVLKQTNGLYPAPLKVSDLIPFNFT